MNGRAAAFAAVLLVATAAMAVDVPRTGGRVEVGGFVDGLAVVATGDGKDQRPGMLAELRFRATAAPWLRGHLALRGELGGPYEGAHAGIVSLVHTFQNHSPSAELAEAYAEMTFDRVDVLVGIQKTAWGRLDGLAPTDVVVPRDLHDPLVRDLEEAKRGVPMLQATWDVGDVRSLGLAGVRLSGVWVPLAVPARLPLQEERWFPESLVGSRVVLPRRATERRLAEALGTPVRLAHDLAVPVVTRTLNRRPPSGLEDGGIGLRLAGTMGPVDWTLYHYTGPETAPNLDLLTQLRLRRLEIRPDGTIDAALRARAVLRQAHDRVHMTGVDAAMTLGDAAFRAELAVFQDRAFLRIADDLASPDALSVRQLRRVVGRLVERGRTRVPVGPLFFARDAVEWGIGVDHPVAGGTALFQVQQIVLTEAAPRLLVSDPETRFVALLRRSFLAERLEVELRGLYGLTRGGWFMMPRVSYRVRDDLTVRLGYLAVGGSRHSFIGQFGENDEVVFQARYSF